MSYQVNGVANLTIPSTGTYGLPISLEYAAGTQEPVSISITDLPKGVTASAYPQSGTPSFASLITFTTDPTVATGSFPIKIKTTAQSGSVKELSCSITTTADCANAVSGSYEGSSCGSNQYTIDVQADADRNNIIIKNFGGNATIKASLDCASKTIIIPTQYYYGSYTCSGTGTFTDQSINISYTINYGTSSDNCTMSFHK
ncbi:hypothetical protein DN068_09300 [Taibaiella soli]|uniref:Uncharacterized protein n=2 Tax=Taibaiella soli TaxID=1649169 RepID=A0A2W2B9Z5_9BACT|nr:hypothetical protein DN068_09300 [Taibaiella soli]